MLPVNEQYILPEYSKNGEFSALFVYSWPCIVMYMWLEFWGSVSGVQAVSFCSGRTVCGVQIWSPKFSWVSSVDLKIVVLPF